MVNERALNGYIFKALVILLDHDNIESFKFF